MEKRYTLIIISFFCASIVYGQCPHQVMHTSGTQTIAGIAVTVTSSGIVDTNSVYCPGTKPYFAGYHRLNGSGEGSYTFSFSPAIPDATLNFSGTSNVSSGAEEVHLFVNGIHYAIPAAGSGDGCDSLAVLTVAGNIAGCTGCTLSGWSGTIIPGPITTLAVLDTVLLGQPNGTIFSLFICNSPLSVQDNKMQGAIHVFPNPFTDQAIIEFPVIVKNATLRFFNSCGQQVKEIDHFTGERAVIKREGLPSGFYYFILESEGEIKTAGKIIAQ